MQPANDAPPDIIVTGERRARRLQDTAASVAVFGTEDIEKQPAADRLESLLPLVPNVQLGSGGEGVAIRGQDTTGVIRDLPAFLGGARPRTTLQIDGRPADYFELVFGFASLWDLERVEIFRSPQTITQGRNAIAGAIFATTADPTFEWEGKARTILSTGGRRQVSGAVGGPLAGERLAFRISADLGRDRPKSKLADLMIGAGPDIDKQWLVRAKLLAIPTDALRIEAGYTRSHSQMPQLEGIRAPFKVRRDPQSTYGVFGSWISALTGEVTYDASSRLHSTTTTTFTKSRFRRYAPEGLGQAEVHKRLFTGEEIVRWSPSDRLNLLGGVHRLGEDIDQHIDISMLTGIGDFTDRQTSQGVFGEIEWKPLPGLTLAGAVRYQRDTQDRTGSIVGSLFTSSIDYRGRFDAWLPRLTVSWTPRPDFTIGALTQKAYNPGGSTLLLNGVTDDFDAETMWDHEVFARGRLDRGRLRWSVNLFIQHFRDAQRPLSFEVQPPVGPPITISELANAPRAKSRGAEAEITWKPEPRWSVRAALGLLDTQITRTPSDFDPLLGKQFQRAPHISGSAGVEWNPIKPLLLSAQMRANSGYYSDDTNIPMRRVPSGAIADAKASYDLGKATLSAYVRNVLNRYQITYYQSATLATAEDPREFGLELGGRF